MTQPTIRLVSLCLLLAFSSVVQAYVGPTLGLGVIGTAIAIIVVSLLSVFAFVFLPLRRLWHKRRQQSEDIDQAH